MPRKTKAPVVDKLDQALKDWFGYDSFRPGQKEIIKHVLKGKNCMVYAPTSFGKSILGQLPALIFPGLTVVVSPLISLMADQTLTLQRKGIPATFVNSSIPLKEQIQRIRDCQAGLYKLLYVSPERFKSQDFKDACEMLNVSLFVLDEIHCHHPQTLVSIEGYDEEISFEDLYKKQESGEPLPKAKSFNEISKEVEYKQITRVFRNPFQKLISIEFDYCGSIEITPNHEIFTHRGYIKAGELTLEDKVKSSKNYGWVNEKGGDPFTHEYLGIQSILHTDRECDFLYDIEVKDNHNYFVHTIYDGKYELASYDQILTHNCISQWGHDFRPDYQRLAGARKLLGDPAILGLTATATPFVKSDILKSLELPSTTKQFSLGFARPNLTIEASFLDPASKYEKLLRIIRKHKTGMVYCSTVKTVEKLHPMLAREFEGHLKIGYYHGELPNREKDAAQDAFIKGSVDVIVSTTAMGMGIDRPDLRFVATFQVTASLSDTYQMVGRAGRDEEPAWGYVLGSDEDIRIQEFFIDLACPPRNVVERLYQYICRVKRTDESLDTISKKLKLQPAQSVSAAMSLLNRQDFIDRIRVKGQRTSRTYLKDGVRPLNINWFDQQQKRYRMEQNLKDSLSIFDEGSCPTKTILDYFEDEDSVNCGRCSVCEGFL